MVCPPEKNRNPNPRPENQKTEKLLNRLVGQGWDIEEIYKVFKEAGGFYEAAYKEEAGG